MCGSGPAHVSGWHLVAWSKISSQKMETSSLSGKGSASGSSNQVPQKEVKLGKDEKEIEAAALVKESE